LLTVLLRLVFVLYAEDRDLLPSLNEPHAKDVYEKSYSLRGLYAKLVEDAALHPDTMDERRGAWGRLLALFRLIHGGHRSHFIQARGGKLFDPDVFPFIEGRQITTDHLHLRVRAAAVDGSTIEAMAFRAAGKKLGEALTRLRGSSTWLRRCGTGREQTARVSHGPHVFVRALSGFDVPNELETR